MGLERFAWLSVVAAVATIALKTLAWWLTGSVGLLSDALESLVNLAAALLALSMLRLAASPPDAVHQYGFSKAEYFSAGIEGAASSGPPSRASWRRVRSRCRSPGLASPSSPPR
jgi:divalent metal cation (Fe/Co/Zn/Cd) transporter